MREFSTRMYAMTIVYALMALAAMALDAMYAATAFTGALIASYGTAHMARKASKQQ